MPHLDPVAAILRYHAGELSREAKIEQDRAENAARIREQVEPDPPDDAAWDDWARSKLSDDELHPDYFPEQTNEMEDV
jgi:hypothetical protein